MNKSKLELLLEAIEGFKHCLSYRAVNTAYQAYMEERKTIPQQGDLIEVRNSEKGEWIIKKFISFANGLVIADDDEAELPDYWKYYRIPTPKNLRSEDSSAQSSPP